MKNIFLILVSSIFLTSCSWKSEDTINTWNNSWTTTSSNSWINNQTTINSWELNETETITNNSLETTIETISWSENILPINEVSSEAEKELSDELNSILNSIDSPWEVK